ncbi:sensor histidine kinase [Neobacillus sp. PS3-40]|uniref:HAMP domain-containing sensor histidine kinase n=1 Tax=Neobacillus sp. PS3-40 TaxID=3070679 RepID=UPI0027E213F4|nr:sensor histidine kinase [Neobacillus sp. PS3-40]WML45970.1 sensor histidine kinase [Neobacillus sp. PS3-40]
MDIKLKSYSQSNIIKIAVFMIVILCFTGVIRELVKIKELNGVNYRIIFEDNYFLSDAYVKESDMIISNLMRLIGEYKNEENIKNGGSIDEEELRMEVENLFAEFQGNSRSFNPQLSQEENYKIFKVEYADKITLAKDRLIQADLKEYHLLVQNLEEHKDPLYYVSDGKNTYSNSSKLENEQLKTYPTYMKFEKYKSEIYPKEIKDNQYLYRITESINNLDQENTVVYVAFTKDFLNQKVKEWKENKVKATNSFYMLVSFLAGLLLSFLYLVVVTGRKSSKKEDVHFNPVDKLYNDINLLLCIGLVILWGTLVNELYIDINKIIIPITIPIAVAGLVLVLSLVKHFKNKTLFRHTLIYSILSKLVAFIGEVYKNGSVGVKTVLIVIGYPIAVALTFFMFPVTIGVAAWFALKKIKSFHAIQEGVERIKDGDIHHCVNVDGDGEFGRLAANINSITDGLKKAVDSELKGERLKSELITNVSHDIRTPLTSIITYVDLLKKEQDPSKVQGFIEILDQKSKRLKVLTDNLFDAAKASSGNIPVHFERIDMVSLLTQGLGEVSDKIEDLDLKFKMNYPKEKVYIAADGKLMWRAIENLLSNIFKYALQASRIYIDIEDLGNEILLTFKNISAYELNISADELMERFKRGDESRSSQGSGLGLSIAKSLIEIQKGKFIIQVDGDLFKAMIYMPKNSNE